MNITQIIEKLKTDSEFSAKYTALKSVDAIIEQAKKDGFDVTKNAVEEILSEMSQKKGELSEADLALVSGGGGTKNNYTSECRTATKKTDMCSYIWNPWCDHYRRSESEHGYRHKQGATYPLYYHTCAMGCYPTYEGDVQGKTMEEIKAGGDYSRVKL